MSRVLVRIKRLQSKPILIRDISVFQVWVTTENGVC